MLPGKGFSLKTDLVGQGLPVPFDRASGPPLPSEIGWQQGMDLAARDPESVSNQC